ncbi:MAG: hypothetical protein ABIP48_09530 [Planctomycetota bacterium]
MIAIVEQAAAAAVPEVAMRYDQPELRLLVALCRELQRHAGNGTFFLATRTAGELVGVSRQQASRWLRLLVYDSILNLVNRGDRRGRRASEFRYLGD